MKRLISFSVLLLVIVLVTTIFMSVSILAEDIEFTIVNGILKKYNGSGGEVTIPDDVMEIGEAAFKNCINLTKVVLNGSHKITIDTYAFEGCINLKSESLLIKTKEVGNYAFSGCTSLESVSILSVDNIGKGAFSGCTALKSVYIGNYKSINTDGTTRISEQAFYGCTSLSLVSFKYTLTEIDDEAFYGCTSLKSINIPFATKISEKAFGYYTDEFGNTQKINGFTIEGYIGSTGEKYASESNFIFKESQYYYGDVNYDKNITAVDALIILQYTVGKTSIADNVLFYADVNTDSKITAVDALMVLQMSCIKIII